MLTTEIRVRVKPRRENNKERTMTLISIDPDKCKGHGHCAAGCPSQIIHQTEKGAVPTAVAGAQSKCIQCGHCAAVCPENALVNHKLVASEPRAVIGGLVPSAEQVEMLFKARRSIRNFRSESVSKETLERLIEIARYAPTGKNAQPVRWLVLDSEKVKEAVEIVIEWAKIVVRDQPQIASSEGLDALVNDYEAGKDRVCYGAPNLVITYGNADDRRTNPACLIALAHLELATSAFNLGACWSGYIAYVANNYAPLAEFLGLSQEDRVFGSMLIGHPEFAYQRIPARQAPPISWIER
jgi:nitroreductase/NAD-dependent dihydropyrimidine dehydrogenase PreA subunit